MNIIIAIDSFKGCLSSALANLSAADGVLSVSADAKVVQMPVSDGGEGWLSAYHAAIGGELITKSVRDPLMRWIEAQYLVKDQTAVVEIAQASGLPLLTSEERNPMVATSYGTGQLIVDAVRRGCKEIMSLIPSAGQRAQPMSLPLRKEPPPRWCSSSTPSPSTLPTSLPSTSASIVRTSPVQAPQAVSAMPSCNT